LVTLGIIVFVLLTLAAVIALPVVLNHISLPGVTAFLAKIGRGLFFWCSSRWRWRSYTDTVRAAPSHNGAGFAAIVWLTASAVFSWYVANFGSYNKTYGSLGAIIGFMTWIWLSMS
jgi:membrane protein